MSERKEDRGFRENIEYNKEVNGNTDFIDNLKEKLPEFFTSTGIFDLEKFQENLKTYNADELSSGYKLDFIGKNYAKKQVGERPTTVIVPDQDHNAKEENKNSKNLFFTGDNLEVLRHLQQNYANSVDFIYIDPPYNTGSDGFVYPDKFDYSDEQLMSMFNLNEEELMRMKSIQDKSTHSAWLAFMYPRLYIAKKLLKDTGVIFVSIDDNEQANLKLLMDEIFGEGTFIANMIIDATPKNDPMLISTSHEYCIVYVRNENLARDEVWGSPHPLTEKIMSIVNTNKPEVAEKKLQQFYIEKNLKKDNISNYRYVDKFGVFRTGPLDDPQSRGPKDIRINLKTGNPLKIPTRGWSTNTKRWDEWVKQNLIYFPEDDTKLPAKKTYLTKNKLEVGRSVIKIQTRSTTNYLRNLFNGISVFNNPKPLKLIKYLISLMNVKNPIILDFFAGSATTADAVMQLNVEDGGHRQYMMVQLDELTKPNSPAYKAGYTSIDQISRARIEKAAEKIRNENSLLIEEQDLGFKHYRVLPPKQEAIDTIEYDENMQLDIFDNMINIFSSDKLEVPGNASGFDTILQTYLVSDNYKFDVPIEMHNFAGISLPYVNYSRIYLISENWGSENTKALVNAIGTNKLPVQTIVVYGYTIEMESIRELEIALNQLENKVTLQVRY